MTEFVHLHNHSDFSLLDGAAPVKEMAAMAKSLGMRAIALTDHGNMFGSRDFDKACRENEIKPIIGTEFYMAGASRKEKTGTETGNKYFHLIALARNAEGYQNLVKLSSISFTEGFYYKPRIDEEVLAQHAKGLVVSSACLAGEIPSLLLAGRAADAEHKALYYKELFDKDCFYLELQDHGMPEQKQVNKALVDMAARTGIPLIATNDIHYIKKEDFYPHDILLCVGTNRKRDDSDRMRFPNSEFYVKSADEMAALFGELPEALSNTLRIADMVDFSMPHPGPMLPDYEIPQDFAHPDDYLRHLTYEGLLRRYPHADQSIRERADYELSVITSMGFTGYFLIVWDFIDWAKRHDIPVGPGRGSGAGSIVAYSLRITDIDPLKYDLLFERFLNPDRISMPDFDIDFCYERRGEVIDYVTRKYGAERVGQIITFGTLKAKAVVKDVARALGLPFNEANDLAKLIPEDPKMTLKKAFEQEPKLAALEADPRYADLFKVGRRLEGLHRHSSLHAAGIVIGKTELSDFVPLYRDPKTGMTSTQYTMDYLEDSGLVKMDFLGLKTLTLVKNTIDLLRKRGIELREDDIADGDAKTYKMLGEGKSTSVFQFESQGMQHTLKRAKPNSIEELTALNALYRPGPMDNIDKYVDTKFGREALTYPAPALEKYLKTTYGVIVYQEQVMQVAREIAGYSLGQADLLRRAMGKKKKEIIDKEKGPFIEGAVKRGYTAKKAEEIFTMLEPFAGYGFNKSHAAAYSVLAYRTAYLKANYPAEFMAANLSNEITNTDKLTQYISEAKSMGLDILAPDINRSDAGFSVRDGKIVYGFLGIKGVGDTIAHAIVAEREAHGIYADFMDFLLRLGKTNLNRKTLECLIHSGCFDSLKHRRKELALNIERAVEYVARKAEQAAYGQVSLFDAGDETAFPPFAMETSGEYSRREMLGFEKELLGFYFSGHPMDEFRLVWERSSTLDMAHFERASSGRDYVVVAMLREFREIITKSGKKMAFGLLEDYNGSIEIVLFPDTLEKIGSQCIKERVLCLRGTFDDTRGKPSLKIAELLDPEALREKSWRAVHIKLSQIPCEDALVPLRELLFSIRGSCKVFFHIPLRGGTEAVVEASSQLLCASGEDALERIRGLPVVESVWQE